MGRINTGTIPTLDTMEPLGMSNDGRLDWDKMRLDYIQQNKKIKDLASENGCSRRAVELRASRGFWNHLRKEYQMKAQRKALDISGDALANQWAETLADLRSILAKIRMVLDERDADGNAKRIKPETLKTLTSSIDLVIKNMRLLNGESTETIQIMDGMVERIFVVIEMFVPPHDRARLSDELGKLLSGPRAGRQITKSAA